MRHWILWVFVFWLSRCVINSWFCWKYMFIHLSHCKRNIMQWCVAKIIYNKISVLVSCLFCKCKRDGVVFTPRWSYAVRLSVWSTRVLCDKTKLCTVNVLIPNKRATTLVFRHQQWLVSDAPRPLLFEICAQSDPPPRKTPPIDFDLQGLNCKR